MEIKNISNVIFLRRRKIEKKYENILNKNKHLFLFIAIAILIAFIIILDIFIEKYKF